MPGQAYKQQADGRGAAYEDLADFELCQDLAGKFARKSAKKTGDGIGGIRDRYDMIVIAPAHSSQSPLGCEP